MVCQGLLCHDVGASSEAALVRILIHLHCLLIHLQLQVCVSEKQLFDPVVRERETGQLQSGQRSLVQLCTQPTDLCNLSYILSPGRHIHSRYQANTRLILLERIQSLCNYCAKTICLHIFCLWLDLHKSPICGPISLIFLQTHKPNFSLIKNNLTS